MISKSASVPTNKSKYLSNQMSRRQHKALVHRNDTIEGRRRDIPDDDCAGPPNSSCSGK